MEFSQRSFQGEIDQRLMEDLACQTLAANLHVTDLPYRFSSGALNDPENARLWFDRHGQLAAWAVLQVPFWTLDYVCHTAAEAELHAGMLAWADQRARAALETDQGHPCWFANVFSGQADRIRDLEGAGYQWQGEVGENSLAKVLMRRTSQTSTKVYLPPAGFTVRPLAGMDEVPDYVALHRAAFGSTTMTEEWRARTLRHPNYQPDLDIVVETPDGRLAAFCICWFDEASRIGRVEPLGCHQDFRRFALGRVTLSDGLRRLQSRGAETIYVETDVDRNTALRLYESFDFQVIHDVLVYRIDYAKVEW
ncbi:MAG: GNAT family N-acetyltransferase [Anaerolineales bacterium]|nr:GNAT family N-acetyltransferase [Anaerolineales bacterium]